MSFVHHDPDLSRDFCFGCSRPVAVEDLVRDEFHSGLSCCRWHPYHRWCVLEPADRTWDVTRCAECAEVIPRPLLEEGLQALAERMTRPHAPAEPGTLAFRRIPHQATNYELEVPGDLATPDWSEGDRWEYFWRTRVYRFLPVHQTCAAELACQSALKIQE